MFELTGLLLSGNPVFVKCYFIESESTAFNLYLIFIIYFATNRKENVLNN